MDLLVWILSVLAILVGISLLYVLNLFAKALQIYIKNNKA